MLAIRSMIGQRRTSGPHERLLEPLAVWKRAELGKTTIDYRCTLKGARMVLGSLRKFATFIGCSERELLELAPLLLHLEALVYRADYHYEALQQGKPTGEPDFIDGFDQVLALYGLGEGPARRHVENLITYFEWETEIVCGRAEIDEAALREVTRLRSSDWRLAIDVIQAVLARPCSAAELEVLERWYTLYEIRQDLLQYAEDIADNSFNTLRLYVQLYGPDEGVVRLKDEQNRLTAEFSAAWQRTSTTEAARLWRAFGVAVPPLVLAGLPWALVRGYAEGHVQRDLRPSFPAVVA